MRRTPSVQRARAARARAKILQRRSAELREKADTVFAQAVRAVTAVDHPFGDHGETFYLRLPRLGPAVALARHDLGLWLRSHGVPAEEAAAIVLACSEACANAVEHAARPAQLAFEVEARCEQGDVRLAVRDFGEWTPAVGNDITRGRGLRMIRELMDAVDVEVAPTGTYVVMRRSLVH